MWLGVSLFLTPRIPWKYQLMVYNYKGWFAGFEASSLLVGDIKPIDANPDEIMKHCHVASVEHPQVLLCMIQSISYWNFGAASAFCKRQIKAKLLRTNFMYKTNEIILCLMGCIEWCQPPIQNPSPVQSPNPIQLNRSLGLGLCMEGFWKGDEMKSLLLN